MVFRNDFHRKYVYKKNNILFLIKYGERGVAEGKIMLYAAKALIMSMVVGLAFYGLLVLLNAILW